MQINIPNWLPVVVVVSIGVVVSVWVVVVAVSVVVVSVVVVEPSSSSSQRRSPLMQVSQVSSRVGQSLNKMHRGFGDFTEWKVNHLHPKADLHSWRHASEINYMLGALNLTLAYQAKSYNCENINLQNTKQSKQKLIAIQTKQNKTNQNKQTKQNLLLLHPQREVSFLYIPHSTNKRVPLKKVFGSW
jgi:hypothetical protein